MLGRALLVSSLVAFASAAFAICAATMPIAAKEAEAKGPVIVALGDSLTAGWELPAKDAFPAQLKAALRARGKNVEVLNAGVSGDTVAQGLARADWSIPPNASAVIIELGANDALLGFDPAATKKKLEELIKRIQARRLPILLTGMEAPRNLGEDYVEAFRAMYRDLAEQYDLLLYPFFLEGVALNEKLTFPDGMHPNAKGIARIVEGILPKVEELIVQIGEEPVGAAVAPR